jgi:hypothetical protein
MSKFQKPYTFMKKTRPAAAVRMLTGLCEGAGGKKGTIAGALF